MSSLKQRRILVAATQAVLCGCDDQDWESFVSDEECEFCDDSQIGDTSRVGLAAILRRVRTDHPQVWAGLRQDIQRIAKGMARNPKRWSRNGDVRAYTRLYPHSISRKGSVAKSHKDCCYCGFGLSSYVCGECSANGIDGPVIRGTEVRKSTTYIRWTNKR